MKNLRGDLIKFDLTKIEFSNNDEKRGVTLPSEPNTKLAELIGILIGDGHVAYYPKCHNYDIEISGHSDHDYSYHKDHINYLIKDLFNITPKFFIWKTRNEMRSRILSKAIFNFMKMMEFPGGRKGNMPVSAWIMKDGEYMRSFLRGLADTDFSLVFKRRSNGKYSYPVIKGSIKNRNVIGSVEKILKVLKIKYCVCYDENKYDKRSERNQTIHSIYIYGKKNLELWMKLVGFNNKKHLNKYIEWKNNGFVVVSKGRNGGPEGI